MCKIGLGKIGKSSFDLITQMIRQEDDKEIARIKTGMVCFDYQKQKVQAIPQAFLEKFQAAWKIFAFVVKSPIFRLTSGSQTSHYKKLGHSNVFFHAWTTPSCVA